MARRRSEELTEIGRLFRGKLGELREAERRNQRGRGKRSRVARGQARLQAVQSPPGDDTLLSPAEVAELLKVTTKTVWRWAHEGLRSTRTIRRAPPLPLGRRDGLAQLAAGLAIGRAFQVPQLAEGLGELAQELERFIGPAGQKSFHLLNARVLHQHTSRSVKSTRLSWKGAMRSRSSRLMMWYVRLVTGSPNVRPA